MIASKWVRWLARTLAVIGGVALIVITIITVVSITGRAFVRHGLGPIPGDFELVEAGVGFAVFSFLPWCQLNRGHATVDLFTSFFPDGVNRFIEFVSELLMSIIIIVIAWRLAIGMMDKIRYGETTFILQFPVWWPFAACMVAAVIAIVVSLYMTGVRLMELVTGRSADLQHQGSVH